MIPLLEVQFVEFGPDIFVLGLFGSRPGLGGDSPVFGRFGDAAEPAVERVAAYGEERENKRVVSGECELME